MRQDLSFLRDPARLAAIFILVVCGAGIAVWVLARGDLVGADARAYWGGVRLWLGGGDPLNPPPPYMPYVYWPWSLPIFTPWAALPWETAWFVYRALNILLFGWSVAWAYRQHPMATAVLVAVVTIPLAATLDTGNITLLCACREHHICHRSLLAELIGAAEAKVTGAVVNEAPNHNDRAPQR